MRRLLLTLAATTALAGTACSDITGVGDVAGSYELVRVNGQSLPASDNTGSVTFYGGVLELDNDRTFVDLLQYRGFGDPAVINDEEFGRWERSGSEIRLEYDRGFVSFAERQSSSRLTVRDNAGNRFEYRRF